MSLLTQIYQLKTYLKRDLTSNGLIDQISEQLNCQVYLVNSLGKILASSGTRNPEQLELRFKQRLVGINESVINVPIEYSFINEEQETSKNQFVIISPLKEFGYLILAKPGEPFNDEEQVLAEISSSIADNICRENIFNHRISERPDFNTVLKSLTHSEIVVLNAVFTELNNSEGIVISSKIADAVGASRSTIVNGLRKLEIPGIISVRSLGMRGTYIKVGIPEFIRFLKNQQQKKVG